MNIHLFLAKALLFFSGFAALIYQTIWIKQLSLVVGIDVYAITTGVSGFFAGLALGSALFGRFADRISNPLRLYAVLEVGIAVLSVMSTLMLTSAPPYFVALEETIGIVAWVLPFALVAVPATLMGGTLPALLALVRPDDGTVGRASGDLYAASTAGAIGGALLTVFLIVPTFGIKGAAFFAAGLNMLLAGAALVTPVRPKPPAQTLTAVDSKPQATLALSLYALAGGVALGYEVVWTQVIVQFLSTRAMAFSIVLATYLAGLVIGSALYARFADRITARWSVFGWLIAGSGLAALLTFFILGPWLPEAQDALGKAVFNLTHSRMLMMSARFALAACIIILPSTLLLGATFPAAARLCVVPASSGRDVGLVLALNTALGIAGTLVTGFVLVPWLGLARSLGVLACVGGLIGAVAVLRAGNYRTASFVKAGTIFAVTFAVAVALPHNRLATLLADARGGELVFYEEGPSGTVAVVEQKASSGSFRRLYIQGVSNTGDAMPSKRYMRLQTLTPLLIHVDEPKSALVIALGTGITAGAMLTDPRLERRLALELLEPVAKAARLFEGNYGVADDPRIEIRVADGRHELMRSKERFDVITLEPPPPAAAGVVNLYSRDFYELAKTRLNESGVLAQWWPIATQNDEDSRSLVRSMLDVFPYVSLWSTEVHEMMLIGSDQPLSLNYSDIEKRFDVPETSASLREIGINTPADLLATFVTDRAGLEVYAGDALPVTDDRPRIEYANWVRPNEITRILPKLLALRTPPPTNATSAQKQQIEKSYRRLRDFYELSVLAYKRDRQGWAAKANVFMRDSTPNAYFDWVLRR